MSISVKLKFQFYTGLEILKVAAGTFDPIPTLLGLILPSVIFSIHDLMSHCFVSHGLMSDYLVSDYLVSDDLMGWRRLVWLDMGSFTIGQARLLSKGHSSTLPQPFLTLSHPPSTLPQPLLNPSSTLPQPLLIP